MSRSGRGLRVATFAVAAASLSVSAACAPAERPPSGGPPAAVELSVPAPPAEMSSDARAPRPDVASAELVLRDPSLATAPAPGRFTVRLDTSQGSLDLVCVREWAPHGVDRFHHLVTIGFFTDVALFRVIADPRPFVAQFGIHGDPSVSEAWRKAEIPADPVRRTNARGTVAFAMAGRPTSRTTQLFINLADNAPLDDMGFAPICEVVEPGLDVARRWYAGYGEQASRQQARLQTEGNVLLRRDFPELDYVRGARVLVEP